MNVCYHLIKKAKLNPNKKAVVYPKYSPFLFKDVCKSITFDELENKSAVLAYNLSKINKVKRGQKALVFIKPSLAFSIVTFALFRLGVVPIFIDPGMGKENLLKAIQETSPDILISVPVVHLLRQKYKKEFSSIKHFITTGKIALGKTRTLNKYFKKSSAHYSTIEELRPDEMAAILFTSGGTGAPKGVVYTHQVLNAQIDILKNTFKLDHNDVDLPGFPLFSLFSIAIGMTSCIPDMNPAKPANASPEKLIKNIKDNGVTFAAGSPAIWERVADYAIKYNIKINSIKYLVMFGAPVKKELHIKFSKILDNGTTFTPYGATESLPVSNISGRDILNDTSCDAIGRGTCVGKTVYGVKLKIIKPVVGIISNIKECQELSVGKIGEIIVKGNVVTKKYFNKQLETQESKVEDVDGVWHRIGDLGYLDNKKRLWFCGRKSHLVCVEDKKHYSVLCEEVFNMHSDVYRSALIGPLIDGKTSPGIVIERKDKKILQKKEREFFFKQLKEIGERFDHTREIDNFYIAKDFPVDVRHNIKIDRIKLKKSVEQHQL